MKAIAAWVLFALVPPLARSQVSCLGELEDVLPWRQLDTGSVEAGKRTALSRLRQDSTGLGPQLLRMEIEELAVLLDARGKPAEAEPLFREALEMRRRPDHTGIPVNPSEIIVALNNLAVILDSLGNDSEAGALFDEARWRRRGYGWGTPDDLAEGLTGKSAVLDGQGDPSEAEAVYRENLEQDRANHPEDSEEVVVSLHSLAFVLSAQGKVADAEPLWREVVAKRIKMARGDDAEVAASLCELARTLDSRGRTTEAESLLRKSLAMRKRLFPADHADVAAGMHDLASVLAPRDSLEESEKLFRAGLEMRRRLNSVARDVKPNGPRLGAPQRRVFAPGSPSDLATSLCELARVRLLRRDGAEAESLAREALQVRQRHFPSHYPEITDALRIVAGARELAGDVERAEALYRDALAFTRQRHRRHPHPDVAACLTDLSRVLMLRGQLPQAEPLLRQAVRMYATLITDFADKSAEGDALTLAAAFPAARDLLLSLALLRGLEPAKVYDDVWAEKGIVGRVIERRHLVGRARSDTRAAVANARLAELRGRRAELLLARPADASSGREADLAEVATQIARHERELGRLAAEWSGLELNARGGTGGLRALLPPDAAFIDVRGYDRFLGAPTADGPRSARVASYLAFLVSGAAVECVDLGPAAAIDASIRDWREALTAPEGAVDGDISLRVRELVWEKIQGSLPEGVEVLYVSPDLAFAGLPWAALPGDAPGSVLLERFAFSLVPHAPFLAGALGATWDAPAPNASVLAVGGVDFGESDEKATVGKGPAPWPALPHTADEVGRLKEIAGDEALDVTVLVGPAATVGGVLERLPGCRFLHLATHGFLADHLFFQRQFELDIELFERRGAERVGMGALVPMLASGLVLAGANRPDTPARGILTGEHLIDRDLASIELVVLSACESGLGEVERGEGVLGLQRAFHVGGARNVVGALWKVPDAATKVLMIEFYRNLWQETMSPAQALRRAQLAMRGVDPAIPSDAVKRGIKPGDADFDGAMRPNDRPRRGAAEDPTFAWAAFTISGPGTLKQAAPSGAGIPPWADVLEFLPNPQVVTHPELLRSLSALRLPWRVRDRASGIEMLLVPPGTFRRGASAHDTAARENEHPAHEVALTKAYYLGRYEVQVHEWKHVRSGEALAEVRGPPIQAAHYDHIQEFLESCDGLRLPTEAEWEYACRAGSVRPTYGKLDEIAWSPSNAGGQARTVGGKVPNSLGFHDMLGNVWELCSDLYGEREYLQCTSGARDPTGPAEGEACVMRGGSYNHRYPDTICTASYRASQPLGGRLTLNRGFRVARDP